MAITIKRVRPGRYSKTINGSRAELSFVIRGLPVGTEEHQVRQLAEPEGANPDALPDTTTPFSGIPYYADDIRIEAVDQVGDNPGAVALFRVIYTDRPEYFFSGPGVLNTSFGRSSTSIEEVPVWSLVDGPEGFPIWEERKFPYERRVTHRIYRGIVGVSLEQAQNELEANLNRLRPFGSWNFLLADFDVGRTGQNQIFASIEFIRNARIPEFGIGAIQNDILVPEIGPLDRYASRGVTYVGGGAQVPPVVAKVDGTTLYQPWQTLSFAVDGVQ